MTIWQAVVLGVVQGISEFLPISSSGHLIIGRELFGLETSSLTFDVALHVATLLAVVWMMRKEIVELLQTDMKWKLIAATLPVVVVGLTISDQLIYSVRTVQVVAASLIMWGVVLWLADQFVKKRKTFAKEVTWKSALLIGCAQVIALIPGTSRAGITMIAGLFSGLDRVKAAKFSFLLSVLAICGAGLLTALDAAQAGLDVSVSALIAGFVSALLTGAVCIGVLLRYLQKGSFTGFAIYRIILGILLLVLFA